MRWGRNAAQPSWRAGTAGDGFLTAVGLRLGSKGREYAAGKAVTSQHPRTVTSQRGREEELPALLGWAGLTRTQKWSVCLFFPLPRDGW